MTALRETAPAKINLGLTLGPLREDGRHLLVTVMQPVALCDRLSLSPAPLGSSGDITLCEGVEGENLVDKAIAEFRSVSGWRGAPLQIEIEKKIPVAAGMAGGSADAGAALRLLARVSAISDPELLMAVATELGADVPGQLEPRRYLASGAGEKLHALPEAAPFGILVVPSDRGLSTADVFAEADRLGLPRSGVELEARQAELVGALAAGAAFAPPELLVNDLEPASVSLAPELAWTLDEVRSAGAQHAMVCGSGPTVIGLFDDLGGAQAAALALSGRTPAPFAVEPWYPSPFSKAGPKRGSGR
jgi:4-diphosphocytidyl-2-C-methyl-D-erythritol kinase